MATTRLHIQVLAFLWVIVAACGDSTLKSFQLTFPPKDHSAYARLRNTITSPLKEFTLCYWVRPLRISVSAPVFSYDTAQNDNELTSTIFQNRFYVYRRGHSSSTNDKVLLGQWNHMCTTWSADKHEFHMFLNGTSVTNTVAGSYQTNPVLPGGIVIVGQEQDTLGGGFTPSESLSGDVSEIHLWDYILCHDEISRLSQCKERDFEGNVIAWRQSSFLFSGPVIMSPVNLCSGTTEQ